MKLFDILINDILGVFIDVSVLNSKIGIANWSITYLDIFKLFFVVVVSYFIVWMFLIVPIKCLKKIMNYNSLKGGKK